MGLKKLKKLIGIKPYYENGSGVLYYADCIESEKNKPSLFNPYIEIKNKTKNKPLGFNI